MSEEICKDSDLNSIDLFEKNFQLQSDEVFKINEDIDEPKEENESSNDCKKVNKMDIVCGFVNKWVSRISITSAITQKHKGSYKTGSQELLSLLERVMKRKSNNQNNLNNKPGVVGLSNHGNTCYINSVVQCLSNCQTLTNFILSNEYKKSFNSRDNRLFSHIDTPKKSKFKISKSRIQRQRGSSVIVDQFASLIKGVWYGRYNDEVSLAFKNQLSKMEKQFRGSYQQDSHEFLLWLMSKLHEDLAVPLCYIEHNINHNKNNNNVQNNSQKKNKINKNKNVNNGMKNNNKDNMKTDNINENYNIIGNNNTKPESIKNDQNIGSNNDDTKNNMNENGDIKENDIRHNGLLPVNTVGNLSNTFNNDDKSKANDISYLKSPIKTTLNSTTSSITLTSQITPNQSTTATRKTPASPTTTTNITPTTTLSNLSLNKLAATSITNSNSTTTTTSTTLATSTTTTFTPPSPSTSIIHHLFQAHYKSTLTCLNCNHTSITIDPFLTISLPILPLENRLHITILVVFLNTIPNQKRMVVEMESDCRVVELKNKVSQATSLKSEQFILAEVSSCSIKCLPDNQLLHKVSFHNKVLQCIEVPVYNKADNHVIMVVLNRFENGIDCDMFGYPIVLHMHKSSCLLDMHQDLLFEVKQYISNGFEHYSFCKTFLDFLLVNPCNPHEHYYMSSDSYPLCSNAVERAVNSCPSDPKHIFVVAEWYQMSRNNFTSLMRQQHTDNKHLSTINNNNPACSLDDCLLLYTQQEQLCGENAWCCAGCGRRRVESVKSLQLSTLPEVLVLHLKRFKNTSSHRSKLHTFISFPLTSLCLDKYLAAKHHDTKPSTQTLPPTTTTSKHLTTSTASSSTIQNPSLKDISSTEKDLQPKCIHLNQPQQQETQKQQSQKHSQKSQQQSQQQHSNPSYDLFAVCNHFGNLSDGHYTAYCKNSLDKEWYHFDDTQVCSIPAHQIVSKHAYLLFYQKRSSLPHCDHSSLAELADKNICSGIDISCSAADTGIYCGGDNGINCSSGANVDYSLDGHSHGKIDESVGGGADFFDFKKDDYEENYKETLDLNNKSASSSSSSSPSVRHKRFCLPKCFMYSGRSQKSNKHHNKTLHSTSKSNGSKEDKKIQENKNNENCIDINLRMNNTSNNTSNITSNNTGNNTINNTSNNTINITSNNTSNISSGGMKNSEVTEAQKLLDNLELLESMQESTV